MTPVVSICVLTSVMSPLYSTASSVIAPSASEHTVQPRRSARSRYGRMTCMTSADTGAMLTAVMTGSPESAARMPSATSRATPICASTVASAMFSLQKTGRFVASAMTSSSTTSS